MCRVVAYMGPPISVAGLLYGPDSSLIKQSYSPKMLQMLNLAGFGMVAWDRTSFQPERPFSYHSEALPMFDSNLRALSEKVQTDSMIAHVRGVAYHDQVTLGQQNLHPFRFTGAPLAMAHNGDLARFNEMRFALSKHLSPEIAGKITGNTDSEWVYALLYSQLDGTATPSVDDILGALRRTIAILRSIRAAHGIDTSSALNLFISTGSCMVVLRYTFDFGRYDMGKLGRVHEANFRFLSLWYTTGASFGYYDGTWKMNGGLTRRDAVLIASEPLTQDTSTWLEVPEYSALLVRKGDTGHDVRVIDMDD